MAELHSLDGRARVHLGLLEKTLDPFQQDLEWFAYELRAEVNPKAGMHAEPPRTARGKMNRKEFNQLLEALDALLNSSRPLRFEPADLSLYLEWSRATPLVFLIVTWVDAGPTGRSLEQRFPAVHAGLRFLTDENSVRSFRDALESEFLSLKDRPPRAARVH